MMKCPKCNEDVQEHPAHWCQPAKEKALGPSDATAGSGRDWYAEYRALDRVLMVIQTMLDHAFKADDGVPGDHVVERLYNLIAAIHPEGALPNPLAEYMAEADGQNAEAIRPATKTTNEETK